MFTEISLTNFRCFQEHKIEFQKFNILVGKNNSGKSNIIDALKLISNVCRYGYYRDEYLEERDIPFPLINLRHNYAETDSMVRVSLSNNISIEVIFPFDDRPYINILESGILVQNRTR